MRMKNAKWLTSADLLITEIKIIELIVIVKKHSKPRYEVWWRNGKGA